jgi:hypothetical protein
MKFKKIRGIHTEAIIAVTKEDQEAQVAHGFNLHSPLLRPKTYPLNKLEDWNVQEVEAQKQFLSLTSEKFYAHQNNVGENIPPRISLAAKNHGYIKTALGLHTI